MNKAFVLGAGLGTRLRPLTDQLPKPLIPVYHRPLITYAFDHLIGSGVREFIVNTHHLPECYREAFPDATYRDRPITFRHEPVLLETAGGIANIADLINDEPFIVYNGDILTDLPLAPLIAKHAKGENIVTLVLRSQGPGLHITTDESGKVLDIRNLLGTGHAGTHQFTGIYALRPDFLQHLTPGKIESVIPVFLSLISQGMRIGSVVADEGQWWDLGDSESYFEAHEGMMELSGRFPAYAPITPRPVHESATLHPLAVLRGLNVVGPAATVPEGAALDDCLLWTGAHLSTGTSLRRCIVRAHASVSGDHANSIL